MTEPDGTNGSKHHHASLGSANFRTDHEYHGSFRNHENVSDINIGGKMSGFGEYPRGSGDYPSRQEPTGFETAKVNRTQRSTNSAGNGQAQQGDPWAVQQSSGGNWGSGPDSEPPF
ncbi:hypothetical protein J2Y41_004600 [Arthrobacter sp. 1088]|uniref:hypothetical protein n=1 Tax=Arthrobacter sp. 1088 TaxID=2817768 RepID=UPI0028613B7B|nr:hypothetical protein [Arthrobacter sp. 1088]MDR6689000.1 hypothetical protein [Arthrobacter sp. 1088]